MPTTMSIYIPGSSLCTWVRVSQPDTRVLGCLSCAWARTHQHQCQGTPRWCSWRSHRGSEQDPSSLSHRFHILAKQIDAFHILLVNLKLLKQVIAKPLWLWFSGQKLPWFKSISLCTSRQCTPWLLLPIYHRLQSLFLLQFILMGFLQCRSFLSKLFPSLH